MKMPPVQQPRETIARRIAAVSLGLSIVVAGAALHPSRAPAQAKSKHAAPQKERKDHPELLDNYPSAPAEAPAPPAEDLPSDASKAASGDDDAALNRATLSALAAKMAMPTPQQLVALPAGIVPWTRVTLTLQNPEHRERINRWLPETYVGMVVLGRLHKFVGLAVAATGAAGPPVSGSSGPLTARFIDFMAIAQIELLPLINVWMGHMPVPADRAGLSAPYFIAPWRYPGQFDPNAAAIGPKTGSFAGLSGNNGLTLWGEAFNGHAKYYVGSYVQDLDARPLTVGRVHVNLLSPESGFFNHSSYYGQRGDLLSVGLSIQYQPEGSTRVDAADLTQRADYLGGNVDVLFEKRLGELGIFDAEAAFYRYGGRFETYDWSYFGLVSYLTPFNLWFGRVQPLVRVQQAHDRVRNAMFTVVDAQLGYIVDGNSVRLSLGYTRHENRFQRANALFLGVQLMK